MNPGNTNAAAIAGRSALRLAANLTLLYPGLPLAERARRAAADGFNAVEILWPYDLPAPQLRDLLAEHGLQLALVNTPLGPSGEFGLAGIPGRQAEFQAGFLQALALARSTGCGLIHTMAGQPGNGFVPDKPAADVIDTLVANLRWAAPRAADAGLVLTLEALNRVDFPGYCYALPNQPIEVLERVDSASLRLQFDLYHAAREGLALLPSLQQAWPHVAHVQVAGAPLRDEPAADDAALWAALNWLADQRYAGWLGLEYRPRGDTSEGLAWCEGLRARA